MRSAQDGPHPGLRAAVLAHARRPYARPIQAHNQRAFDQLQRRLATEPRPLVLDAGCGVGHSTDPIAALHPEAWVIGVDRSAARLSRQGAGEALVQRGRRLWLRADLVDLWRLAGRAGWRLQAHYLLYPNPYPKPAQLRRRWPAHPVFFDLLRLGGALVVRSNWQVYLQEWQQALALLGGQASLRPLDRQPAPISPFEAKYQASGHPLWELRSHLRPAELNLTPRGPSDPHPPPPAPRPTAASGTNKP